MSDNEQATTTTTDPAVWTTLQARDAKALIDFFVDALGFVSTATYDDGDVVHHAELRRPGTAGGIMLGTYDADKPWGREPGSGTAYVVVPDVDALYERATAQGATIMRPLDDTDYGSREFGVDDLEGNSWTFGTYPGAPLPE
ncbi:VOC family protein [Georgenia sp. Z1344]|uniref:VOC family protein n=1 Tax=Georgenia sp. Z1344 TaxID=3416706 RepID=UPI003CF3EE2F